jgi:hypothetical protein
MTIESRTITWWGKKRRLASKALSACSVALKLRYLGKTWAQQAAWAMTMRQPYAPSALNPWASAL